MTEQRQIEAEVIIMDETPEQAARAISTALDFLRLESDAIGMLDVSELIGRARAKANEYCSEVSPDEGLARLRVL